jgi:peptide-methionine (S)-S-oxide reductase
MKLGFRIVVLFLISSLMVNCQATNTNNNQSSETETTAVVNTSGVTSNTPEKYIPKKEGLSRAYFASGCFWCVEAVFESVKGVEESVSGYSGGTTKNPTYESSNTGRTGHAEAVEIFYDASVVDFSTLVDVYFGSQNVAQINGQGPDNGSQYRSIIFYQNAEEKAIIDAKVKALNQELNGEKVAAEITPFEMFWVGEDYHQDFEKLHPNQRYIQGVSIPRLKRFQAAFPELIKEGSH